MKRNQNGTTYNVLWEYKTKKGAMREKIKKKKKHGEDWEEDKKKPKGNQIKIEEWEAES